MKNWNELSITDKNDIIKVAVQNGITTLPEIRERYNEFAEGGAMPYDLEEVVVTPETSGIRTNAKVSNVSAVPMQQQRVVVPYMTPNLGEQQQVQQSVLPVQQYRDASEIGMEGWTKRANDYNPEDIYKYVAGYYNLANRPDRLPKLVQNAIAGGYGSNFKDYITDRYPDEVNAYYASPRYQYDNLLQSYRDKGHKITAIGFGGIEKPYYSEGNNAFYYNPTDLNTYEAFQKLLEAKYGVLSDYRYGGGLNCIYRKGGHVISDEEYQNRMRQVAQENWRNWGYRNEEEAYQDQINNPTYDYRHFYANNPGAVNNAETHWPDTYKGALHRTFRTESAYNGVQDANFNPRGIRGGRWTERGFVPHGESFTVPNVLIENNAFSSGGKIHIKPSKKGTFTAAASRHGMGVQEFASKVLAHKENYSPAMVKKANFARNASKWHGYGGNLFGDGGEEDNEEYYPIWLDGITVKPSGNRPTTRDDWSWANWRELQNEREQQAAESVRRGIDRNGTPIAAGIYGLAAAPFAIESLGSSAVANGVRTGLQAMNTAFTPSTWLNPVTGTKLLSPTVGTIADAGIQGAFAYEGLNGLWNQGKQGTLLSNPASTVMHGLEVLPLVGVSTNAARNIVDPAVRNFDLWKYNVGKRGAESVLRTTNSHNPVPETVGGIIEMAVGKQGGPKRLSNIARYILSGERNGVKGYYNSFAPYNSHSGRNRYFTGFYSDSNELNGKDDLIDAFLYGKDIDPAFGVKKVGAGEGFGVHSKYINDNYAGKASNIPVYELNTIDGIPEEGVAKTGNWYGANGDVYFGTDKGTTLNAAGHMETEGLAPNGTRVIQAQDIWKFHPSNYNAKWLGNPNTAYGKLLRWGLKKVDSYGTPVILRTKWQPAFALGGPLVEYAMGGHLFDNGGQYTVNRGDSLWKIAHDNNMPLSRLRELNPQVKGNMIHPGDVLRLSPEFERQIVNLREERQREEVANMDNFTAIQAAPHDSNYVVVDKPNKKLQVYDRDNNLVYESDGVSFGKSGDDYNTITYVNANGSIRNNAGNNSTPAGISVITGIGTYHGLPSFTRGRINDDGTVENIASSIHYGNTEKKNMSNGCVRANSDTLKELSKYVGEGTAVYTLPEQKGSKFSVKNNKLNYTADNPFGMSEGPQRYWDDYNVRKDKSYSPLAIVYNGDNYDDEYNANVLSYTNALSINKEALQKRFNLSSDEYNRLAELAVGIAEQESKFGTSLRYKAKQQVPDEAIALAKNFKDSDSTNMFYAAGEALSKTIKGSTTPARSRGLTQIKIGGDNKEMQDIYKELGINENTINNPYTSALATLSRLAYMYNSEVKGRNFKGADNAEVSPYDALLYKYMGRGSELRNKTATPDKNKYISNVKKYASDFDFLEERLVEKR